MQIYNIRALDSMTGPVRQPIDEAALEKYLNKHVPEIKSPFDLKQVWT